MALVDEKLARFQEAVEEQAKKRAKEIENQADVELKKEIEAYENHLKRQTEHKISFEKEQIEIESKKSFSRFQSSQREEYFHCQQALEDELFSDVEEKLLAFQDSEGYRAWFFEQVEKVLEKGYPGESVFSVGTKDLPLEKEIQKKFGKSTQVKEDIHIRLGGFIYQNNEKHYVIDYSMDTVLKEARNWFHETVELPN